MLTTNNHSYERTVVSKNTIDDDENDDDETSADEQGEEQVNVLEPTQGLFSDQIFSNVIEMFRFYQIEFNLIEYLRRHEINSQYDYIRLINYIRSEVNMDKIELELSNMRVFALQKPSIDDLQQCQTSPWLNEKYFQTVIDNDPALQFGRQSLELNTRCIEWTLTCSMIDIEEDLHQLDDALVSNTSTCNDPLTKANEKIRQLESMIDTFK
jgi:hypothetical protein